MKYRFKLIIMASALFCMLTAAAPADNVIKNLYIDGQWIDDANVATEGLSWPYDRITIGAEGDRWYMYNEYVGKIDDFAIYDGVLSPASITAHWNARGNYANYQAAVTADNPLLWLKLDEADTNNLAVANNSGSIGIDGEYIAVSPAGGPAAVISTTAGFVAGSNGVRLAVNGRLPDANGTCVSVWDGDPFNFSAALEGDVTVEIWVNYTDLNDYPRFFQHNSGWDTPGGYGISAVLNDGNNLGIMGGGVTNYMAFVGDVNNGQWHHIVVTYDSTYIPPEAGLYETEVLADGPSLYLKFDEVTELEDGNGLLVDSSGNDCWAIKNTAVRIEQVVGSMGKAAYVNAGWIAAANQQTEPCLPTDYNHAYAFGPNDISVEFWVYTPEPGTLNDFAALFTQCQTVEPPTAPPYYAPGATRGGPFSPPNTGLKCRMLFGDVRTPDQGGYAYTADLTWKNTDPNWHHYVAIWDEIQGDPCQIHIMWYSDGVNYKNSFYNAPGTAWGYLGPEMDHILIGRLGTRQAPAGNGFMGYIDEFAIYPKILDITRINAHRAAWQPHSCQELWERQMQTSWSVIDRDKDCDISFYDYAYFAQEWAQCNDPCDPGCTPNW